jgi:hypothetical protein
MVLLGLILILVYIGPVAYLARGFLATRLPADPAASLGIAGLIASGLVGISCYFVGMVTITMSLLFVLLGAGFLARFSRRPHEGIRCTKAGILFVVAVSIIPLVGILAPSTMLDWDSLAYHMAVPKMWLADGNSSNSSISGLVASLSSDSAASGSEPNPRGGRLPPSPASPSFSGKRGVPILMFPTGFTRGWGRSSFFVG